MTKVNPGEPDHTKFTGKLNKPVQVNFTIEQKKRLAVKCKEYGVGMATLIRMKALEALGLKD